MFYVLPGPIYIKEVRDLIQELYFPISYILNIIIKKIYWDSASHMFF